jgi:hypothetical protein
MKINNILIAAGAIIGAYFLLKKSIGFIESKFLPPYNQDGKTTFKNTQGKSGVYIIKENGSIVYVGHSRTNLYKTLYRHFQAWNHKTQPVVTYQNLLNTNKYTVRVILATPQQAVRLEGYLVNAYEPRDNENKLKLYKNEAQAQTTYDKYVNEKEIEPDIIAPF